MSSNNGNVVVIFGATGAVGSALVKYLQEVGLPGTKMTPKIVAVGAEKDKCEEFEKKMKVHTMCKDATDPKQVMDVFDMHREEGICAVANCIGDFVMMPMAETEPEELQQIMSTNLMSAFNILKAGAQELAAAGGGSLACVGSATVHYGMRNHEAWSAAKGAVEAMHRSAAATYASQNVRINCVASGLIRSEASAEVSQDAEQAQKSAMLYPMKRLAAPEDVAHCLAFLLHPKTCFTTGAALPCDGGLTCVQATGLAAAAVAAEPAGTA